MRLISPGAIANRNRRGATGLTRGRFLIRKRFLFSLGERFPGQSAGNMVPQDEKLVDWRTHISYVSDKQTGLGRCQFAILSAP